ncbi:MAG: hypothetical protein HQ504_12990 [Rhodospirillaceae bacterium]|nr:hypothetical protein [Rhodospirillaceae bacterium]
MPNKSGLIPVFSLGRLFGRKKKKASKENRSPQKGGAARFFNDGDLDDFQDLLREQCRTESSLGSAQIIDLTRVRDYFGDKWPSKEKKIHAYVRQAIERRLSEKDMYTLFKDERYIIVFSELTQKIARLKCGLIAQEISKRLFGSDTSDFLDIISGTINKKGKFSFNKMSSKPDTDWKEASETTTVELPGDLSAPKSAPTPEHKRPGRSSDDDWSFAPGKKINESFLYFSKTDKVSGISFSDFQSVYRPMWNTEHKAISAYCCIPARIDSNGSTLIGGAAMPLGHASPENAILDQFVLQRIVSDLIKIGRDKRKMFLVEPVHYITLNDPKLHAPFLELCRHIPQELRKLLIFEVLGLPDSLPSTILARIMLALKPFGGAVSVRRRLDASDLAQLHDMGVNAVGADISNYAAPEEKIIKQMAGFCESASMANLHTYIHGLRSVSLISSALGAGFTYVDGDPVMSVIDLPKPLSPFDLENLYGPMLTTNT